MTYIEATPLHELLAGKMRWTDALWAVAIAIVDQYLTDEGKIELESVFLGPRPAWAPAKSQLEDFRQYPPTMLLAAFDMVRWRAAVDERIGKLLDDSEAEALARMWETQRHG